MKNGIFVMPADSMQDLKVRINTINEFATAILDEVAVLTEAYLNEKNIHKTQIYIDKVS